MKTVKKGPAGKTKDVYVPPGGPATVGNPRGSVARGSIDKRSVTKATTPHAAGGATSKRDDIGVTHSIGHCTNNTYEEFVNPPPPSKTVSTALPD